MLALLSSEIKKKKRRRKETEKTTDVIINVANVGTIGVVKFKKKKA